MKKPQRKRGRPPKADADAKSVLMQVRVSTLEKQGFLSAAGLVGQELSVWVRDVLRREAQTRLRQNDQPVPFLTSQPGGI